MRNIFVLFAAYAATAFTSTGFGQTFTTSAAFLRVSSDIRGAGLGDAGIGSTPDAYSALRNISKVPFATNKSSITASYTPWMNNATDGIYLGSLSGYYKLGDDQAITASVRYFHIGEAKFADESGMYLGSFSPTEYALDAGYSRKISSKFSVGIGLRYINSKVASGSYNGDNYKAASAVAGDLSAFYNNINTAGTGFTAGINISNLGSQIQYTDVSTNGGFLPATLGIGAAYTLKDEKHRFTMLAEINKALVPIAPADSAALANFKGMGVTESWFNSFKSGNMKATQYSAGIEYAWDEMFFLRVGGLMDGKTRMVVDSKIYITCGIGLKYHSFNVDFAYLGGNAAGPSGLPGTNTLRFGVGYNVFGTNK